MRALWAILAGMALLVSAVPSAPAAAAIAAPGALATLAAPAAPTDVGSGAADQAAREIADARERANAAADALFAAESDLDALELDQQGIEREIEVLQAQIDALRASVEQVAINRFTRSGTSSLPLLTGFRSAGEQAQVDILIDVVNETSADDFDEFEALNADLDDRRTELEAAGRRAEEARAELERRREAAMAEVERLKEVEADRLEDEAVRKALQAEEAERRRRDDDAADALRAVAAAQDRIGQQTQTGSGGGASSGNSPDDRPVGGDGDIDDPGSSTNVSTGGTGGGLTGTIGPGGRPGSNPGVLGGAGWLCPVQGVVSFGDTWGAPRSGGRSHQGVDMIGVRGLPIIAVVDGFAQSKVNTLGGNTVWLSGADGNKYYYAHLDSWGTLGQVAAGTVIGYLGDTGNAKFSITHLHLQIHPGGGAAVNPFSTVSAYC